MVTKPLTASVWLGRVLVRGRDPLRVGRTRTSSLSQCSPSVLSGPPPGRRRYAGPTRTASAPTSGRSRAGSWRWWRCRRRPLPAPEPDDRAGGGHPVVGVGAPIGRRAAGRGRMVRESGVSSTRPPSARDVGGDGGEPVGLVSAQVPDAPQRAGPIGEHAPSRRWSGSARRRHAGRGRCRADVAGPVTVSPVVGAARPSAPIGRQDAADRVAGLVGAGRPVRHGDGARR